jgi:hypothetical protein
MSIKNNGAPYTHAAFAMAITESLGGVVVVVEDGVDVQDIKPIVIRAKQ